MFELADLYQQLILDHNRSPRNHGRLDAGRRSEGYNPLCGDRVTVYLALDGEVISDIAFEGVGCAISTAAASLMTEAVKGKTMSEAMTLFERFRELVTGAADNGDESLGKLDAFAGVRNYPARVKCATLVWHTLKAAIDADDEVVTTE